VPNEFSHSRVALARWGVVAVFLMAGLLFATFASRLVLIRQSLGVTPAQMGFLLLMITVGSILMMPVTGHLIERFGETLLLRIFSAVAWVAMVLAVYCSTRGWAWLMAVPLLIQGATFGSWDVAMNYAGSRVEQQLGRSIMPQFHAGFSMATFAGAGIGWLFSHSGAPLMAHVGIVAAVGLVFVQVVISWLLPPRPARANYEEGLPLDFQMDLASDIVLPDVVDLPADVAPAAPPAAAPVGKERSAWLEPRTLLIGVVMLSVTLTEGSANDWVTSAIVQSFKTPETTGIVCLAIFLAAMTTMRILGTRLVDRLGRVITLRLCAVAAIVGLLCFGLGRELWLVMIGAGVWGLGAALGFPVGISAASDDPLRAARRTAVVSTIGYVAFLAGPPILGMIAGQLGFRNALMFILIPAVAALLLAGWTRPLQTSQVADAG